MRKLLLLTTILFMTSLVRAIDVEQSTMSLKLVKITWGDGTIQVSSPSTGGGGGGTTIDTSTGCVSVSLPGDLWVSSLSFSGNGVFFSVGSTITITEVGGWILSASTQSSIVCDFHYKTGSTPATNTSIWTTQSNRITFAANSNFATPITTFDNSTIPAGSVFSLNVDQAGNTNDNGEIINPGGSPGADLTLYIKYYKVFSQ